MRIQFTDPDNPGAYPTVENLILNEANYVIVSDDSDTRHCVIIPMQQNLTAPQYETFLNVIRFYRNRIRNNSSYVENRNQPYPRMQTQVKLFKTRSEIDEDGRSRQENSNRSLISWVFNFFEQR